MKTLNTFLAACMLVFLAVGCDSSSLVDTNGETTSDLEAELAAGKKGGSGGNTSDVPMWVTISPLPSGDENSLADDIAGKIGTSYGVAFAYDPVNNVWLDESERATAGSCPVGYQFWLLETGVQGTEITTVLLRGGDGNGNEGQSDKVSIDPQPVDTNGFTLIVDRTLAIRSGRGKSASHVCDVYVGTLTYAPAG